MSAGTVKHCDNYQYVEEYRWQLLSDIQDYINKYTLFYPRAFDEESLKHADKEEHGDGPIIYEEPNRILFTKPNVTLQLNVLYNIRL